MGLEDGKNVTYHNTWHASNADYVTDHLNRAILNNGFEQYYVFVNPMIQEKMEVLDYYVYRIGMLNNDIPASTAVSMVKTFISVGLVFGVNKLSKKTLGQSIL